VAQFIHIRLDGRADDPLIRDQAAELIRRLLRDVYKVDEPDVQVEALGPPHSCAGVFPHGRFML
jgi:hypothetical protein